MRVATGASYIPVLDKLVNMTTRPILELGCGEVSTPFLHWMCYPGKRKLVSYESVPRYYRWAQRFQSDFHQVHLVSEWDSIDLSEHWGIAFVDHSPADRRIHEIKRLVHSEFVVIHDSEDKNDQYYRYSEILPLFRYVYRYEDAVPNTTVLSNKRQLLQRFHVGYGEPPPSIDEINVISDRYMKQVAGFSGNKRPYTICITLGQIYTKIEDPELKLKLRYAATIAQYTLEKLSQYAPVWLKMFYPRFKDYERLMSEKDKK